MEILSLHLIGNLPRWCQQVISRIGVCLRNLRISRYFIKYYCAKHYRNNPRYLEQFCSPKGDSEYQTFQDFFTRVYRQLPQISSDSIWPCEGLICDKAAFSSNPQVRVKKQPIAMRTVFGQFGEKIPNQYHFCNVYLHNSNYHRIHAPITGVIKNIQHIPGDLLIIRPWFYGQRPSLPSLRNERIILEIRRHSTGEIWYLAIVGGFGVATIKLSKKTQIGQTVAIGEEIAIFELGSTCCIAASEESRAPLNSFVSMGDPFASGLNDSARGHNFGSKLMIFS